MNRISQDKKERIEELLSKGVSQRVIATILGCNKNTVGTVKTGRYTKPSKQPHNPTGLCECGCGQRTTIHLHDDKLTGRKKGDYRRFVHGHWHNLKRKENPNHGRKYQRKCEREAIRERLVMAALERGQNCTIEQLRREVAPHFRMEGVSRMLNFAREMADAGLTTHPRVPQVFIRTPQQIRPVYERPEIPYERETELPMLSSSRRFLSLDDAPYDDGEARHAFIPDATVADPLQILMDKEEEWEKVNRQREISRFEEFQNKKRLGVELGQGNAYYHVRKYRP